MFQKKEKEKTLGKTKTKTHLSEIEVSIYMEKTWKWLSYKQKLKEFVITKTALQEKLNWLFK